jgi:GAF domain-containing protein
MPMVTRKHRSVCDYESEKALLDALQQRVETSDSSSCSLESDSELSGADWLLPNCLSAQPSIESELRRLTILKSYRVLDSEKEQAFDRLAEMAGKHCNVPWASVSFVDLGRQWFKSMWEDNLDVTETSRKDAFCAHTILQDDLLEVRDTHTDSRFCKNPYVTGTPGMRFYAGVPLVTPEGVKIGTLCIMDKEPRPNGLSQSERTKLESLASETMRELVQRRENPQTSRKRASSIEAAASTADQEPSTVAVATSSSPPIDSKNSRKSRRVGEVNRTPLQPSETPADIIPRPVKATLLPDPKTKDVDPDEYLVQLVEALYGVTLKVKPALDLEDYFHGITETQMSAYSMQVVSVTRENDVNKLIAFYQANGRQSLDCFNRFGEGLLNMTCRRGFKDSVHFLLSEPVSLNVRVRDDYGRTPMHDACWNPEPQLDICTWICEQDPSLFLIADKRGYTPFQYARQSDWHVWRQFLYDRRDLLEGLARPEIVGRFSS